MNQKKKLSILEFSRLTGISRDNLRFYDPVSYTHLFRFGILDFWRSPFWPICCW